MKFFIKDFFSKCDQIRRKLRIWSHLLKKSLVENFIFCAVFNTIPHNELHFSIATWNLEVSREQLLLGSVLSSLQVYIYQLRRSAGSMHSHLDIQPFRNPIFFCIYPKMIPLKSLHQSGRRTNTSIGHQECSFKPYADIFPFGNGQIVCDFMVSGEQKWNST